MAPRPMYMLQTCFIPIPDHSVYSTQSSPFRYRINSTDSDKQLGISRCNRSNFIYYVRRRPIFIFVFIVILMKMPPFVCKLPFLNEFFS